MPHAALKLVGGATNVETPALNENGGIQSTQLIRYMPDPNGITLVQKIGGWAKFYPTPMAAIVRALWAWEDLNLNARLAIGTQTIPSTTHAQLAVITNGALSDITPTSTTDNVPPIATAVQGSYSILITDNTTSGITNYDSVYIATQISIGGIVLFGLYQCSPDGILLPGAYTVWSTDQLGNFNPATSSSTLPVLPSFTTVLNSSTIVVTLPNYTYAAGNTFPILVPTSVGGVTLYGNYVVQNLSNVNQFTIIAATSATSAQTVTINNGNAQFIYSFGEGAIQPGTGYGVGPYGSGGYGTGTPIVPATGTDINAIDWTFGNFGEILLACPIQPSGSGTPFQPIYQWPPGQPMATIIPHAPPVNDGIFVAMPQRQIVAWGSTQTGIQDPLLIRWCDVGNYNIWTATVINQAGSFRIPKGSRIVGAVQGPQQALFWTDVGLWSMQYIGQPLIYGFNEIGTGCGMIARKAAASINGVYRWMGFSQFYELSGNGVQPIPCPIWDVIFQNLNTAVDSITGVVNTQKIRVAVNSLFGEIQWFYPSANGTGEVDSYVKLNTQLNLWDYGSLGRSAWVDQSVLGPPIGANSADLDLYQHEISNDADGVPMISNFQTGYFALSEGDFKTFVDWVWPDFKYGQLDQSQSATTNITFYVKDYPSDTPTVFGPYPVTALTPFFYTRLRGRLVSIQIGSSDLGSWWRIGLMRYRYSQDGRI